MTMERDSLVARLQSLAAGTKAKFDKDPDMWLFELWHALMQAAAALSRPEQVVKALEEAACPVPVHECEFVVGQPVHIVNYPAEWNPDAVFYVTGIRWEHRMVPAHGWDITIASREDIEKGYGQTDGFSPSDLRSARSCLTTAAPLQADASAPASPAIGVQAVKALADRVRALLLVDQPASWEERRKIADELESLSALHPAPEAASAGGALPADVVRLVIAARNVAYADDPHVETLNELDQAAEAFASRVPWDDEPDLGADEVSPASPSDTAPSPKGVSDGVREALKQAREALVLSIAFYGRDLGTDRLERSLEHLCAKWVKADQLIQAALSSKSVPATAEERAASKEGA